jgi:ATP-dependent Clp protease adaptor protein ClpS
MNTIKPRPPAAPGAVAPGATAPGATAPGATAQGATAQGATGSASAISEAVDAPEREVEAQLRVKAAPREKTKPKRQPPYAVILHNDNFNGFDYVVAVLRKVLNYDRVKAYQLTMAAHTSGRSIVWSGVREVAELKADQIRSCGPDPVAKANGAIALRVTLEPLPG